jgi:hypothetical protein
MLSTLVSAPDIAPGRIKRSRRPQDEELRMVLEEVEEHHATVNRVIR